MSMTVSYPGVYIRELEPGIRTIAGVPTSVTAFIGRTRRGPVQEPTLVHSFGEFVRGFGGLWGEGPLAHSVSQFYANGGSEALIVRVHHPTVTDAGDTARVNLAAAGGTTLTLTAASPGEWGNLITVRVEDESPPNPADPRFHLTIEEWSAGAGSRVVASERHVRLSATPGSPRFVTDVLASGSQLARVDSAAPFGVPTATAAPPAAATPLAGGDDGLDLVNADLSAPGLEAGRTGLWALEKTDAFNLLCIPPVARELSPDATTWNAAARLCEQRRAILIVDPDPTWSNAAAAKGGVSTHVSASANAAIYFPRIVTPDPLQENRLAPFAPSGAVAGVIARTDSQRGQWKSPAGLDASLSNVPRLDVLLTDGDVGVLNPAGINCLQSRPPAGRVVWGARTRVGDDDLASQWKYLSVRRTALHIEESLFRGTQWVVFEPNDEPLWSQIRLSVGAFLNTLFRQGAFQGTTPAQAYFVKCDRENNPQSSIDQGKVEILVGFAPLKPAEFVIVSIQQIRPAE